MSHVDGPSEDAPSRSLALPGFDAAWYRSQNAKPEIIAEMEDWTLSGVNRYVPRFIYIINRL